LTARRDIKLRRGCEIDLRFFKAISHEDRYLALHILNERVASPTEVAAELGITVSKASYHMRTLLRLGCAEIVEEVPRRGSTTEHFYRATHPSFFSDEDWVRIPRSMRESITGKQLTVIGRYISQALLEGTFEARDDRHYSWMRMIVDEQGWGESMGILLDALERLQEVQAASRERLDEGEGVPISIAVLLMGFEALSSQA